MKELSGFLHETPIRVDSPGEEVICFRVGDYVLWNGVIGRVTAICNQFPDGSGRSLKNMQVRVDKYTMAYGRSHWAEVKRLG